MFDWLDVLGFVPEMIYCECFLYLIFHMVFALHGAMFNSAYGISFRANLCPCENKTTSHISMN